ncbi:MAG: glycosyltransferase family 2 protein [Chloroflexi bacterium]|nr:glycosyltransferase family 2 protein [Chloroflexota bacterium]
MGQAGPPHPPAVLSIVIPAFNEERRIGLTLETVDDYLEATYSSSEIVVADDGSADGTAKRVEEAATRRPRIRLLRLPHRGKGHAVQKGMLAAQGDVRLFSDADLSVPIQSLPLFLLPAQTADVVIASREVHGAIRLGEPASRHLMGRVFNRAVGLLTGLSFSDTQCGFKSFTRPAAEAIFPHQRVHGFGFDVEVLYLARRLGFRVVEVPVEWHYAPGSKIQPWRHSFTMLAEAASVRWNAMRGRYPARR